MVLALSVRVMALVPGQEPLRWSPIHGAQDTVTAELRGRAFIAGIWPRTSGAQDDAAAHYQQLAGTWLSCLLHAAALDGASLRHVLRWAKRPEDPAPRQILQHHPGAGPQWAEALIDVTTGDERAVGNTRSTLSNALAAFAHQPVIDAVDVAAEHATALDGRLRQPLVRRAGRLPPRLATSLGPDSPCLHAGHDDLPGRYASDTANLAISRRIAGSTRHMPPAG
ncbi:hypothetical protein [Streptomyces specialis]|uniref:hypothetical protein n=1 Tax=Streptomyces specialis TaxID=498367 RepID=UPI00131C28E6|nr:hypothetical protein [Streptomyces specialis]